MKSLNVPKNLKLVFSKFHESKGAIDKSYGKEFLGKIILLESLDEAKYQKLKMKENDFLFSLTPDSSMVNLRNSMHGGCIATGLDMITTVVMSGVQEQLKHNVTTKLSMNFVLPVSLEKNSLILCSNINLIENNQGFCTADVYDIDDCKLLVKSTHLKSFIDKYWI